MTYIKKHSPLVQHRPDMNYLVPYTKQICSAFGYSYEEINAYDETLESDIYLICGSRLLPDDFVTRNTIINSHPGYIPDVRGLDALKWAIFEGNPIGVTTHLLGPEIDAGEMKERRNVEIRPNDSFYELAMRVYFTEINMLVEAISKLDEPHEIIIPDNTSIVHKRMPEDLEKEMLRRFEYRKHSICAVRGA